MSCDSLGPIEVAVGGEALNCAIGIEFSDEGDTIADGTIPCTSSYSKLVVTNCRKSNEELLIGGQTFPIAEAVLFDLAADADAQDGKYLIYFTPTLEIAGVKPSQKAVQIVKRHVAR